MRGRVQMLVLSLPAVLILPLLSGCTGLDFSPDGKRLAVVWTDGILLMDSMGSGRTPLPGGSDGWMPTWSPDGRFIAFVVHKNNQTNGDLILYDVKDNRSRKIGEKLGPPFAWRSDSHRLSALSNTPTGDVEMVMFDTPEGREISRRLLNVKSVVGMKMVWLPGTDDLALIAMPRAPSSRNAPGGDVYIAAGARLHRLTTSGDVIGLCLSTDRRKLLWAKAQPDSSGPGLALASYDLSRGVTERLPFPAHVGGIRSGRFYRCDGIVYASFSPTGDRIALVAAYTARNRGRRAPRQYVSCCTAKMDGSDPRLIDRCPPSSAATGFTLPVWSPDGKHIAVLTVGEATMRLSLYGPDGFHGGPILTARAH